MGSTRWYSSNLQLECDLNLPDCDIIDTIGSTTLLPSQNYSIFSSLVNQLARLNDGAAQQSTASRMDPHSPLTPRSPLTPPLLPLFPPLLTPLLPKPTPLIPLIPPSQQMSWTHPSCLSLMRTSGQLNPSLQSDSNGCSASRDISNAKQTTPDFSNHKQTTHELSDTKRTTRELSETKHISDVSDIRTSDEVEAEQSTPYKIDDPETRTLASQVISFKNGLSSTTSSSSHSNPRFKTVLPPRIDRTVLGAFHRPANQQHHKPANQHQHRPANQQQHRPANQHRAHRPAKHKLYKPTDEQHRYVQHHNQQNQHQLRLKQEEEEEHSEAQKQFELHQHQEVKEDMMDDMNQEIQHQNQSEEMENQPFLDMDMSDVAERLNLPPLFSYNGRERRSFKCSYLQCGYSAKQYNQLVRHWKTHSGEKPFQCTLCSYSAALKHNLLQHLWSKHSVKKKYQCTMCEYSATRRDYLAAHVSTHTGLKLYSCHMCPWRTGLKSNLTQHMKKKHSNNL